MLTDRDLRQKTASSLVSINKSSKASRKLNTTRPALHQRSKTETSPQKLTAADDYMQPEVFSPSQPPSTFIYFNRKNAIDFLITENILKHARIKRRQQQTSPVKTDLSQYYRAQSMTNSSLTFSPVGKYNFKSATAAGTPVAKKTSEDFLKSREVFDELVTAGEKHSELTKKMNPVSPKSQFVQELSGPDKTKLLIKHQHYRIFGKDHYNLQKVNCILRSKLTQSNNLSPENRSTPRSQVRVQTSQPIGTLESIKVTEPEQTKVRIKMFDHKPLLETYQYSNPKLDEIKSIMNLLGTPRLSDMASPSMTERRTERQKSKSMANFQAKMPQLQLRIMQQQSELLSPQASSLLLPSMIPSSTKTTTKVTTIEEPLETIYMPSVAEINTERPQSRTNLLLTRVSTEDNGEPLQTILNTDKKKNFDNVGERMRYLENVCLKMVKQNKRMLKKVDQGMERMGKDYSNLDHRTVLVKESRYK